MTSPIGRAYVEILPDMRSFARDVKAGVTESTTAAKGSLQELNGTAAAAAGTVAHETEGVFSKLKDTIKETAAFALPALGGVELFKFFKDSTDAARAEQKQLAQTSAVLKSTGGVAHVTAGQVEELAKKISLQTGITQTAIRGNENLLLTFTNVRDNVGKGNDIFNQATQAIQDMSTAMNESSRTATIQLGKALNDPVKGATALARVGVMLTDQQKAQIKAMVEGGQVAALNAEGMKVTQSQLDSLAAKYHGTAGAINFLTRQFTPAQKKQFEYYEQGNHLADAQKLILRELHHEFAGSAAAQATAGEKASAAFEQFRIEIGNKLLPIIDKVESFIGTHLLPILSGLMDEASKGKGIFGDLAAVIKALYEIVQPFIQQIWDLAKKAWSALLAVLAQVGPWLEKIAGFIHDHIEVFRTYGIVLLVIVGAWKAYLLGVTLVTKAQLLMNAVMDANPLLLIALALAAVVTAIILAYKHSETFRNIVKSVWDAIKVAAQVAWHILVGIFNALKTAWNAVWIAVKWAWEHIGKPIWEIIKVAAKVLYAILGGLFLLIINSWKAIWIAVQWAWHNIGQPLWQGIQVAANFLWRNVLKPVFGAISDAWHVLWAGATAVWHTVIEPIWDGIKTGVQAVWRFVAPIFHSIAQVWSSIWHDIASVFSSIWRGIEGAIISGINAVIHVINFFIRAIDWILDKLPGNLHINTIHTLSLDSGSGSGSPSSSGGGGLPRANASGTKGRGLPDGWFTTGEEGGSRGWELGFKRGPQVEIFSNRDSRRMTGWDRVPGFAAGTGQHIGGGLGTGGTLHVAGGLGGFLSGIGSSIGGGATAVVNAIRAGVAHAILAALDAAESPVRSAIGALPSGIIQDVVSGGFNMIDSPIRTAILKLGGIARRQALRGGISQAVGAIPTGQHLALIAQALAFAGLAPSPANIADVNTIISYESGWNPNAINLSDSNAAAGDPSRGLMQTIMTTFNAYRLPGLSNNIYNPLSNIVAGIRYAVNRYGSLGGVPGIMALAHGEKYVGYADGSWNVPHDQVARVHQGEMILPRNLARYIRSLLAGSAVAQRDVPSESFSKTMHAEALKQNTELRDMSHTLTGAWKNFMGAVKDGKASWKDFRGILQGLAHDLHLHGDALERIHTLEDRIATVVRRRAQTVRELSTAQATLDRLQAAYHGRISGVRGNIVGGFDITSAGAGGTDRFGNPAAISAGSIIGQLQGVVQRARDFTRLIRKLVQEGLPRQLVTQLVEAGPAAMAQAQALSQITPHQLRSLRSSYSELNEQGTVLGRVSAQYSYHDRIHSQEDTVARLEKALKREDRTLVRDLRDALAGMAFEFDGDKVTLVVTRKQNHQDARGPRR